MHLDGKDLRHRQSERGRVEREAARSLPRRKSSASTTSSARSRAQIILAHERSGRGTSRPDYLPALQRQLMAVISKYVSIKPEEIKVVLEKQDNLEVLQVKIELPEALR